MQIIRYILLTFLFAIVASCTVEPTDWATNVVQDPVVLAALNSKEGQEAKLLIETSNRFADCIDVYNEWMSTIDKTIPEDVVEQTRACRIQLSTVKTESSEDASADIVLFEKAYHPTCNHIPVKEQLLRVEVSRKDLSTFASWATPEITPTFEETKLLREALPLASCTEYINHLFSVENSGVELQIP